jgi:hypothetical protein
VGLGSPNWTSRCCNSDIDRRRSSYRIGSRTWLWKVVDGQTPQQPPSAGYSRSTLACSHYRGHPCLETSLAQRSVATIHSLFSIRSLKHIPGSLVHRLPKRRDNMSVFSMMKTFQIYPSFLSIGTCRLILFCCGRGLPLPAVAVLCWWWQMGLKVGILLVGLNVMCAER